MYKFFVTLLFICYANIIAAPPVLMNIRHHWPVLSPWSIFVFFLLLIIIALIFYLHEKSKTKQRRKNIRNFYQDEFDMNSTSKGLNSDEYKLLYEMVILLDLSLPPEIFRAINLFEHGIDQIINKHGENNKIGKTLYSIREKLGYARIPFQSRYYSSRELTPGQKLSIFHLNDVSKTAIICDVKDVDEFKLIIDKAYLNSENEHFFKEQDNIHVNLMQRGDATYTYNSKILKVTDSLIYISHVIQMKRTQLREFVRLEVNHDIKFRFIKSYKNPNLSKVPDPFNARMRNISGGGMNMVSPEEFNNGDILSLSFNLMGEVFSGIKGLILRYNVKDTSGEELFYYHIKFQEIETIDRDKLIKLIFEKQREELLWR